MSNRVTNAEREIIYQRAIEIVRLDGRGATENAENTIGTIMEEFGISRERARAAVAKASRRKRAPGTPPDTSLHLGPDRRAWLQSSGGIQPMICQLIDTAMNPPTPSV